MTKVLTDILLVVGTASLVMVSISASIILCYLTWDILRGN